jgi:hypothetical protein
VSELTLDGIRALLSQAKRLGLVPEYRPGTMAAVTGTNPGIALVTLDGDEQASRAFNLLGGLFAGARVMTVKIKPHGIYIFGGFEVDNGWQTVLARDFGTGWSSTGGSFRSTAYRLNILGDVELAGHVTQSGTVGAPNTIFTLPVGYRPVGGTVVWAGTLNNNPAAATAPTVRGLQITTAGLVQVTNFAGTINPGPLSLTGVSFPIRTV